MLMNDLEHNALIRIETNQNLMKDDISFIKKKIDNFPCKVNSEKINKLEKVVYGAVALILLAFMANIVADKKSNADENKKPVVIAAPIK